MSCHRDASSSRSVPLAVPTEGMTFDAPPAWTLPQTRAAPARGSTRRPSAVGHLGDDLGEREGEVLGPVRAGGVPAVALEGDLDTVGRRGHGSDEEPDLADVEARVAVQGEDLVDTGQPPTVDDLVRARRG